MLDLLITRHLFRSHTDIDQGELTDLRSASVSNENFAQVAVRRNLHQHLQHCSGLLLSQITEYVKCISEPHIGRSLQGPKGPKVSSCSHSFLFKVNFDMCLLCLLILSFFFFL